MEWAVGLLTSEGAMNWNQSALVAFAGTVTPFWATSEPVYLTAVQATAEVVRLWFAIDHVKPVAAGENAALSAYWSVPGVAFATEIHPEGSCS
jgi:hypothetical protein